MLKRWTALLLSILLVAAPLLANATDDPDFDPPVATAEPVETPEPTPEPASTPEPTEEPKAPGEEPPDDDGAIAPPTQKIPATGIEIDPPLIAFAPGDSVALEALLTPGNSTDGVEWESSDPDVVELEYDGYGWLAVAIAEGEATITATAGSGVTAEALVIVEEAVYQIVSETMALMDAGATGEPESFGLGHSTTTLAPGEEGTLYGWFDPEESSDNVTWISSDPGVVAVGAIDTDEGNPIICTIEGISIGTATITATTDGGLSDSITITVLPLADSISLSPSPLTVREGKIVYLSVVYPEGTFGVYDMSYENDDNPAIWAWKYETGKIAVKGLEVGTAEITVTMQSAPEKTATVQVEVVDTNTNPATDITLECWFNENDFQLGEEDIITARLFPADATDLIEWESSDPSVVSVVADREYDGDGSVWGRVVAEGPGTATITLRAEGGATGAVDITVPEPGGPAEGIWFDNWYGSNLWLPVGATEGTWVEVFPENTTDDVFWSSSNTAVATVQAPNEPWNEGKKTALVTAHKQGAATITASIPNGQSVSFTVDVPREATGFTLPYTSYKMRLGKERFFGDDVVFSPANSALGLIWSSDNPSVADIHESGYLRTMGAGTAVITAKGITKPALTRNFTLTVEDSNYLPATFFRMDSTDIWLAEDWDNHWWSYTMEPRDATDNITWTSSDENVFEVLGYNMDDVGLSAVGLGTATLTGVTEGGLTTTATVYVKPNPTDIALNYSTLTMRQGEFFNLDYSLTPADAMGWPDWWSSQPNSVTVEDGRLYAVRATSTPVRIYATLDNGLEAFCDVTVVATNTKPATAISFGTAVYKMEVGNEYWISLMKEPADTTDKITVTSSNATVVAVGRKDGYYTLTAKKAGTAVLTATSENKGITTTAMVTVAARATGMSFSGSPFTVRKGEHFRERVRSATQWTPAAADAGWAIFTSSDAGVVSTGYWGFDLIAEGVGSATITARLNSNPNVTATFDVTVVDTNDVQVTSIGIGDVSLQVMPAGYNHYVAPVKADIQPLFHTDKITWESLNPAIVELDGWDDDGSAWLVPFAVGTTTIEITAEDSGVTKQFVVTVVAERPTLSFTQTSHAKVVGDELNEQPLATIAGSPVASPPLAWTTSNAAVATVDNSGQVTCTGAGTAVITAYMAEFPAVRALYTVTVTGKVTKITLDKTSVSLSPDSFFTLTAATTPANSTDALDWVVSDSDTTISVNGKTATITLGPDAGPGTVTVSTVEDRGVAPAVCNVRARVVATEIEIDPPELTLLASAVPGSQPEQLAAILGPVGGGVVYNDTVTWSSNKPTVARVDPATGEVTPLLGGTAVITARTEAGLTATCAVTVRVPVTSIALTPAVVPNPLLVKGKTLQLRATVLPANATDKRLVWKSGDEDMLTVSQTGLVTAKEVDWGTLADIWAETPDGLVSSNKVWLGVQIPSTLIRLPATLSIQRNPESAGQPVHSGRVGQLAVTSILPADSTDGVRWTTSAHNIVQLKGPSSTYLGIYPYDGLSTDIMDVWGMEIGTARITARTNSGKTAVCTVTVWDEPTNGISVSPDPFEDLVVGKGKTQQLRYTPDPLTPTLAQLRTPVKWTSLNPAVATVSAAGLVRGVNPGETIIRLEIGNATFNWNVEVRTPSTGVRITPNASENGLTAIPMGTGTLQLTAIPAPLNSTDTITWTSSNEDIATVSFIPGVPADRNAVVTAGNTTAGTAVITATTNGKKANFTVTVYDGPAPDPKITAPASTATIKLETGKTLAMKGTVNAVASAPVCRVWTSSDDTVATVHPMTGLVRAVGTGTATIIFGTGSTTPTGGGALNERTVEVTQGATGITLAAGTGVTLKAGNTANVEVGKAFSLTGTIAPTGTTSNFRLANPVTSSNANIVKVEGTPATNESGADATRLAWIGADFTAGPNPGKATLTFFTDNNKKATSVVTVWRPALTTSITPANNSEENPHRIERNKTVQLRAVLTPAGTNTPIEWESSDDSIATVSPTGLVRIVGEGDVEIGLFSLKTGSLWGTEPDATYYIVGTKPATSITLSQTRLTLDLSNKTGADTGSVTPTLLPVDHNSVVTWTSNKPLIASVDRLTGVITALTPGAAVITATTSSGRKATCAVTVVRSATDLAIKRLSDNTAMPARTTIQRNGILKVWAEIAPLNTTDKIVWSTSNNKVATVTPRVVNGQLTCDIKGVGLGDAVIIVRIGLKVHAFAVTVAP